MNQNENWYIIPKNSPKLVMNLENLFGRIWRKRVDWNGQFADLNLDSLPDNRDPQSKKVVRGTKEQINAYFSLRSFLGAYEKTLHSWTKKLATSEKLPEQFKRQKATIKLIGRKNTKISFLEGAKNEDGVELICRHVKNEWLCRSFTMGDAQISLDNKGRIVKIAAKNGFSSANASKRIEEFEKRLGQVDQLKEFSLETASLQQVRLHLTSGDFTMENYRNFEFQKDGTMGGFFPAFIAQQALEALFPTSLLESARSKH